MVAASASACRGAAEAAALSADAEAAGKAEAVESQSGHESGMEYMASGVVVSGRGGWVGRGVTVVST